MSKDRSLNQRLSDDIHLLGDVLGMVIRQQASVSTFALEEQMRALTKARRSDDDPAISAEITTLVQSLDLSQKIDLARAFTTYFELINVAEANHRIRVIRDRERRYYPDPMPESVADAIATLWRDGVAESDVEALLQKLLIDLVFTAHPTEAKRRTVVGKLQRIGRHLYERETKDLLPREKDDIKSAIEAEVTSLWLSDRTRPSKPSVTDEVKIGLYYLDSVIWEVLPEIYEALHKALKQYYPNLTVPDRFLRFGSWMGGDRDGNPFVTAEVTAETIRLHRGLALERHKKEANQLSRTLSISDRLDHISPELEKEVNDRLKEPTEHLKFLNERYPSEPYRLRSALLVDDLAEASAERIRSRLLGIWDGEFPDIRTADQLRQPLKLMKESLEEAGAGGVGSAEITPFLTQANAFGLQSATLDIRQESKYNDTAFTEILQKLDIHPDYINLSNSEKTDLLTTLLNQPIPANLSSLLTNHYPLNTEAESLLQLFDLLAKTINWYGAETIGPFIISMTEDPADLLLVHTLACWFGINKRADGRPDGLAISPLFETRQDLVNAPTVMDTLLNHPHYTEHIAHFNREITIMIGYSDSNKDAGYLSANWELYQAQSALADFCKANKVTMTLFHGRGGTVARGGGPMKRAILAQPNGSVDGRFRNTEQGEVLFERYSTPEIARRHLEQVVYSVLMASSPSREVNIQDDWRTAMDALAQTAHKTYRAFVYDNRDLVDYWQQATPIKEISQMRIGSRPAKRAKSDDPFAFFRAIPWVFSWMQSRHNLPGWYGIGDALDNFAKGNPERISLLQTMYRDWDFFRAVVDNAQMSLGKADMGIAALYAELVQDETLRQSVYGEITRAHSLAQQWILVITGQRALLDNEPVLKRSLRVRNPYVDPLNFIQVNLLKQYRALDDKTTDDAAALLNAIFLTVNGIAAGLKNTG